MLRCCAGPAPHYGSVVFALQAARRGLKVMGWIRPCGFISRCLPPYRRKLLQLLRASRATASTPVEKGSRTRVAQHAGEIELIQNLSAQRGGSRLVVLLTELKSDSQQLLIHPKL